jgi:hypothetical protein
MGEEKRVELRRRLTKHPYRIKAKTQITDHVTLTNKAASSLRKSRVNAPSAHACSSKASRFQSWLPSPLSSKARPPDLARYDKDVIRRKKMAPRVQRGKKRGRGGSGRRHILRSPSSPTQVHTHCRSEGRALRANPRLRQGAHKLGARRRTQRKEPAPKCTCTPAPVCAGLRLCPSASQARRAWSRLPSQGQVIPAFSSFHLGIRALSSLPHSAAPGSHEKRAGGRAAGDSA